VDERLRARTRSSAAYSLVVCAALLVFPLCVAGIQGRATTGHPVSSSAVQESADTIYVTFETVHDIERFFEEVNYSPQSWADGVRELPRMFVTDVGERWRQRAQNELSVQAKKRIFFRGIAPLALRSNELIRVERERVSALPPPDELTAEDREWLARMATDYRLDAPDTFEEATEPETWARLTEDLLTRVDEVPVSLVLAQAANESGWGTSRFAREGNALFGQWSFGGSGMLPEAQRKSLGNYGVAAFESPLLSVMSYMRNLNSHPAYARLRELRAEARRAGEPLSGYALARGLDRYSERGQAYVDELHAIIRVNRLREADGTYLAPGPVYLVIPPKAK
jgi:uncharacterized FlgJ-related protein